MRRLAFVIFCVAACCLGAWAQGVLKWQETTHDFGTFSEDLKNVKCVIRAVNTGDSAVVITNVVTTCGCTSREYTKTPIAPGDTAQVTLTYHATGRVGAFNKAVYVYTNTAQRKLMLRIKGNVLASPQTVDELYPESVGALHLDGRTIPFGEVTKGASKIAYIGAYNNSPDTLKVSFADVPKHVDIEAHPSVVPPFGLCTITAFFNTFDADQWGLVTDEVTIVAEPVDSVSNTLSGAGKIEVMGVINEDFTKWTVEQMNDAPIAVLSAETVDFANVDSQAGTVSQTVTIANSGKSPLEIRRIYSTDRAVSVKYDAEKVKKGHRRDVTIVIDSAKIDGTYLNAQVMVITNDPIRPKQTLRVVGIVKK